VSLFEDFKIRKEEHNPEDAIQTLQGQVGQYYKALQAVKHHITEATMTISEDRERSGNINLGMARRRLFQALKELEGI
jgi:hypothetical protein